MRIWSLTNGAPGMRAQASGLARALAEQLKTPGEPLPVFSEKTIILGGLRKNLREWESSPDSPPDVVIGCGRTAIMPVLALKWRTGAYAVFTQRPFWGGAFFDAILRPAHDGPGGRNTLSITGALSGITAEELASRRASALSRFGNPPSPRIGFLAGGSNRAFHWTPSAFQKIGEELLSARAKSGGTILATTSPRTGPENIRALESLDGGTFLQNNPAGGNIGNAGGDIGDNIGNDDNPYLDILAASDIFVVTGDSVNMLSEACATAKPVMIVRPPARPGWRATRSAKKFASFHAELTSRNLARMWSGKLESCPSPALNETSRAAAWLANKIRERS